MFEGDACTLSKDGLHLGTITKDPATHLYTIPPGSFTGKSNVAATAELWHARSGHAGMRRVSELHKHVTDVLRLPSTINTSCEPCLKGKAHKLPFDSEMEEANCPGDIVYSDVAGPYSTSREGHRYFITFTDAYSRQTWVVCTPDKRVAEYFPFVLKELQSKFQISTIRIHADKGREYLPLNKLDAIKLTTTEGYTPQHNPVAERMNRTIKDCARTMLIAADLPVSFWADAVQQAARLYNQLPHSSLNTTPFEKLNGRPPSAKHWRIFGAKAFVLIPNEHPNFTQRALSGILVGCLPHGIYRVFTELGTDVESKHVTFDESTYPGRTFLYLHNLLSDSDSDLSGEDAISWTTDESISSNSSICLDHSEISTREFSDDISTESDSISDCSEPKISQPLEEVPDFNYSNEYEADHEISDEELLQKVTYIPPAPSTFRTTDADEQFFTPARDTTNSHIGNNMEEPTTYQSDRPQRNRRRPDFYHANVCVTTSDTPTLSEALNSTPTEREMWLQAIQDEHDSLVENGTWTTPAFLPKGKKPLPSFIILQVKRDSEGKVERFKARIVAGGHMQHNHDFDKQHTPVMDFNTLLLFLNLTLIWNLKPRHVDVTTAFLNGTLEEEIYITLPKGLPQGNGKRLRRLLKAIYGLRQAHHRWHIKLSKDLQQEGFVELRQLRCVFFRKKGDSIVFILVYVDDLLILAKTEADLEDVVATLRKFYYIRALGEVSWFLGMSIKWSSDSDSRSVTLSQKQAISSLLEEFDVPTSRSTYSPMVKNFYSLLRHETNSSVVKMDKY